MLKAGRLIKISKVYFSLLKYQQFDFLIRELRILLNLNFETQIASHKKCCFVIEGLSSLCNQDE